MPETGTASATTNETPLTKNEALAIAAFQCAAQVMTNVAPGFYSTDGWPDKIAGYTNVIAVAIHKDLTDLAKKA